MKKMLINILAICCYAALTLLANCSRDNVKPVAPKPDLVISSLTYSPSKIIISSAATFDISGSVKYTGAIKGIKNLRVTSSLGIDLTVPVMGNVQASGQINGYFTFTMINDPGVYSFDIWVIDGDGRSSNKLTGSFEMIVDPNKLPTPVVLQSVVLDEASKTPLLSWSKNDDGNFYAYLIKRHHGNTSIEIGMITDKNITSTHDPENHGTVGFSYSYSVEVSNKNVSVESNLITFTYPEASQLQIKLGILQNERPIMSSITDEMYLCETGTSSIIKAISITSNTVKRSFNLYSSEIESFSLNEDESKIFIVVGDSLIVLNTSTFDVEMKKQLSFFGRRIVCGRASRLYVSAYAPAAVNGKIKILDADTGGEVGDLGVVARWGLLTVSADNNTLYASDQDSDPSVATKIYKIDISSDNASVLAQREVPDYVRVIQQSSDGQNLYVLHNSSTPSHDNFVDVWSTSTLESVSAFNASYHVIDFIAADNLLFVSAGSLEANYNEVIQFDISKNIVLSSWEFVYPGPNLMQISHDQKMLYAFDVDHSWIVSLSP